MAFSGTTRVQRWALVSATAAPILLVGGWTLAATLQPPGFDPARDTISALAALGATDRWVMTAALLLLGGCHITTASGFREAARPGRIILAIGGAATIGVALFPLPVVGAPQPTQFAFIAFGCLAVAILRLGGLRAIGVTPSPIERRGGRIGCVMSSSSCAGSRCSC
jgi:hypothetical membrane protein